MSEENKNFEELKKFHEMTKPVRFRKLKLFFQSVGLTYEVGKEKISYLTNYLLYKLNILKRYSYRDNVVKELSLPHSVNQKGVATQFLSSLVDMNLVLETDFDIDYFYREKKDGGRKITYYVKNEEHNRLFTVSTLKNISLCIAGQFYYVDSLPIFKMASITTPFKQAGFNSQHEYKTITYDVQKLKRLQNKNLIGVDLKPEDITEPMVQYYYDLSVREFRGYLGKLTLEDLILEVFE